MAAPHGNKFWEIRAKHGRDGIWSSPDDLWKDCVGYFEWVQSNPLWESKAFTVQGEVIDHPLSKMRAMTLGGLCVHLGIDRTTWADYRKKQDFSLVAMRVEEIIYEQKLSGAAADLLNSNIIARELGLRDKTETELTGSVEITSIRRTIVKPHAT